MKIKLSSDFRDYYDHWFSNDPEPDINFYRRTKNGLSKNQQFQILKDLGLNTPVFNTASWFYENNQYGIDIVLYTDPFAHCGEGKFRINSEVVPFLKDPNLIFASEYISNRSYDGAVYSYRHLQIGQKAFTLRYVNYTQDEWRSNVGNQIRIDLLGEAEIIGYDYPLFAIDYLYNEDGIKLAFDFNTAPGIKSTPLQEKLNGKDIYNWIEQYYERF